MCEAVTESKLSDQFSSVAQEKGAHLVRVIWRVGFFYCST